MKALILMVMVAVGVMAGQCDTYAEIAYLVKQNRDKGFSQSTMMALVPKVGTVAERDAVKQIIKTAYLIDSDASAEKYKSLTYIMCVNSGVR